MNARQIAAISIFSICFGLVLSGCSGKSVEEMDPGELYETANQELSNDRYALAIDKLRLIKNKFPYSRFAKDAQLKLADVYFMQESYVEAALAYESFKDLYPKHERVSYAMYRVGLSYYNDIPDVLARDMVSGQKAIDAFVEFLRKFPEAPEAEDARYRLSDTRRALANKELYIGNFYYKRDHFESAKQRFDKILAIYPESDAAKEVQTKMARVEQGAQEEKTAREKLLAEEAARRQKLIDEEANAPAEENE